MRHLSRFCHFASLAASSACLIGLAGCGGTDNQPAGSTARPLPGLAANPASAAELPQSMPSPLEMLQAGAGRRTISYVYEDVVLAGSGFDALLPNNRVSSQGSALDFAAQGATPASLAACAFAVYRFKVPDYFGNLIVRSFFDSPPSGAYIGAANWSSNSWSWFVWDSAAQDLGASGPFKFSGGADNGTILIVVLLTEGSATLNTLALGADIPPLAFFSVAQNPVEAGVPLAFDASGSLDLDTAILLYEWDFDNDGSFETSDTQPLATHPYPAEGTFTAVLRATATDSGTDTFSLDIEVTPGTANQPPVAAISASVQTGDFPLDVEFNAAASTDSDGTIDLYEWDFDGDGTYDPADNTLVPTTSHTYLAAGIFNASVRVNDNDGAQDSEQITITVTDPGPGNSPPTAKFRPDYYFTDAPLTFEADASASTDSDGTIDKYEWDWDNNGSFEEDSGTDPTVTHNYGVPGVYPATLRVTDNDGAQATFSLVLQADNADLGYDDVEPNDTYDTAQALPGIGFKHWDGRIGDGDADPEDEEDWYSFTLDALDQVVITMDFIDAECDIDMKLFESDGTTELDSSTGTTDQEVMQYASTTGGTYLIRVYKFTSDPLVAADYTLNAERSSGNLPNADLQADVTSGSIPLTVNFDASASSDPGGGAIEEYEWDLDGDGDYETSSTSSALQTATYYATGTFNATVRVTNTLGFTDTDSVSITTSGSYDEVEPNNDTSTAQALNFPVVDFNGSLGPGGYDGGDEDWFAITASSGQTLDITMLLHDNFGDLDMRLYDSDGTTERDSSTGTDDDENINYTFVSSGTFYLKLYVYSSTGAGGYELDGTLL